MSIPHHLLSARHVVWTPAVVDAGWIQGYYPVMAVPANPHLTVTFGCIQRASVKRQFTWQYAISGAQNTIRVCADYQQNVQELSESNNCKEETWTQDLPDLVVDQIRCETGNHITFIVKNAGTGPLSVGWMSVADVYVDGIKKGFYHNNQWTQKEE